MTTMVYGDGEGSHNTETVPNSSSLILFLKVWVLFVRTKTKPCLAVVNHTDFSISIMQWTVKGTEYHPFSPWQPCHLFLAHPLESLFLPCSLPLKGVLEGKLVWSPQDYLWTCCPFLWAVAGKKLVYKGLHPAWKGSSWRKCSLQSAHRKTCLVTSGWLEEHQVR